MVIVQSGKFGRAGSSDIPNTRCFDTINLAASTTVVANGKTFTITPLGKHLEESLYGRFLSGFQIRQ